MRRASVAIVWLVSFALGDASSAQTVKPMAKLDTSGDVYFAVACAGGESIAAVDRANEIHLWNLATGMQKLLKDGLDAQVDPGALACDQKVIAVGSTHGTVTLLDFDGQMRRHFDLKEEVTGLALSPDGSKLVVSTANSPVQIWDVASGSREWSGTTSFGNTYSARISPDGRSVYAADGDT